MKLDTNLGKLDLAKREAKRKARGTVKSTSSKPSKKKKDDSEA